MTNQILAGKMAALRDLVASLDRLEGWADTPIDRVQALRCIAETATSALRQAVPAARAAGSSWGEVGRALDMSKQGAQQRYGQSD